MRQWPNLTGSRSGKCPLVRTEVSEMCLNTSIWLGEMRRRLFSEIQTQYNIGVPFWKKLPAIPWLGSSALQLWAPSSSSS